MTPPPPPKPKAIKYLSNKELLAEIARCKNSFCEFLEPQYSSYDLIVNDLSDVTQTMIDEYLLKYNAKLDSDDHKQTDGLVVRLMTYEHIPLDLERKRKSKEANQFHAKTNFPPFKHMLLKAEDGFSFTEVGRSHWEGGFQNGHFSPEKGRMSERLGRMFMMLVQKYGRRGNWRAYCHDVETEALTQRGWLKYDQITEDDQVLGCPDGQLTWTNVLSIYKGHYLGNMFKLDVHGLDAMVSPGHKFLVKEGDNVVTKKVELLKETDRIVLMGKAVAAPVAKIYSDEFVELVGWVVTEGHIRKPEKNKRKGYAITLYQNEGPYADRIRHCLHTLQGKTYEHSRIRGNKIPNVNWNIRTRLSNEIVAEIGHKRVLPPEFLLRLTQKQREILFETMIDGDGWRTRQTTSLHVGYCQKDKAHMDSFTMLGTLLGKQISVNKVDLVTKTNKLDSHIYIANVFSNYRNKLCRVENIDMHGAKRNGVRKGFGKHTHPNEPTVPYDGMIWCVETGAGSFVVRRGKYIFANSNSYNDEMCASALTQLSRVGLQFDESKSQNPFAFYTTTITHVFTRTLNLEKRNQSIRDDLLIHYGMSPSHTRQVENELNKNGSIEPKPLPSKRGRKTAAQRSAEKEAEKPINE